MLRAMISSLALILLHASIASATLLEIPLTGLLGTYPVSPGNGTRTVTVVLPQTPTAIHGASFRVSGNTMVGLLDCEFIGQTPYRMDMSAFMLADEPYSYWQAGSDMPGESGPFTWTATFTPSRQATWSFFEDGVGSVSLRGGGAGTWCYVLSEPSAEVTEAVLILDVEFPVAITPSTWGRIKALYR